MQNHAFCVGKLVNFLCIDQKLVDVFYITFTDDVVGIRIQVNDVFFNF